MAERRQSAAITYSDQSADFLIDTPSSSIDVVISLQSAQRMAENGLDWKKAIQEAGRVLKPGGRFLFVESADVAGESYLEEVMKLASGGVDAMYAEENGDDEPADEQEKSMLEDDNAIFSEVGFDNVDMVLQPHIAGVAIKAEDADLTPQQRAQKKYEEERERIDEMRLSLWEGGPKKRRKKKTKAKDDAGKKSKKGAMS
jgi:SAM-dependent methyltransferase